MNSIKFIITGIFLIKNIAAKLKEAANKFSEANNQMPLVNASTHVARKGMIAIINGIRCFFRFFEVIFNLNGNDYKVRKQALYIKD